MKLNFKIVSILFLSIVGSLSVFSAFEGARQGNVLHANQEAKIRSLVISNLGSLAVSLWHFDEDAVFAAMRVLLLIDDINTITIYAPDGSLYGAYSRNGDDVTVKKKGAPLLDTSGFTEDFQPDPRRQRTKSEQLSPTLQRLATKVWTVETTPAQLAAYILVEYGSESVARDIAVSKQRILVTSILLSLFICLVTYLFLRLQIITKILDLLTASREIAKGNYVEMAVVRGRDEIADLMRAFNNMSAALKAYSEKMEQKVEEKTRSIRYLLDLMPIGIFAIEQGCSIGDQFSAQTPTILDEPVIAGSNFKKFLERSDLIGDRVSEIYSAVDCSIGADEIAYLANMASLPNEVHYKSPLGREKIIELSWTPVVNGEAVVEKVLVTLVDATESHHEKEAAAKKNAYLRTIDELLTMGEERFRIFLNSFAQQQTLIEEQLSRQPVLSKDEFESLLIELHTIKGNARSYGLTAVARLAHESEDELETFRDRVHELSLETVHRQLEQLVKEVHTYSSIARSKLRYVLDSRYEEVRVSKDKLKTLLSLASTPQHPVVNELSHLLREDLAAPLNKLIDGALAAIPYVASLSAKARPKLVWEGDTQLLFWIASATWMEGVFNHLITNSIDHGIEGREERRSKGKDEIPHLYFSVKAIDDGVEISYRDDGRGINLPALRSKLRERGIDVDSMDLGALVASICIDGITTAVKVSELSGRGVGMNAVRQTVEAQGGSLNIQVLDEVREGFAHVQFVIRLPTRYLFT